MQTITQEELQETIASNDNALLINVLPTEYFDQAHIPGSINIPVKNDDFVQKVQEAAGSKDKNIIVYCANESCSASEDAAEKLQSEGFQNVKDFAGGTQAWKESGGEIKSKSSEGCGTSCGCA